MKSVKLRCINAEGVFNITEGKVYNTTQKLTHNGDSRYVWVTNDQGFVSYYDMNRFQFEFDEPDKIELEVK